MIIPTGSVAWSHLHWTSVSVSCQEIIVSIFRERSGFLLTLNQPCLFGLDIGPINLLSICFLVCVNIVYWHWCFCLFMLFVPVFYLAIWLQLQSTHLLCCLWWFRLKNVFHLSYCSVACVGLFGWSPAVVCSVYRRWVSARWFIVLSSTLLQWLLEPESRLHAD